MLSTLTGGRLHEWLEHSTPQPSASRYAADLASVAAVAGLYFGAAKFGLSLAFTTEQVTAVWPPTGIALAAVLVLGYRIWPGIYLGALLSNVVTHEPVGVAAGIALGNTLEACVGAFLLRRVVGFHRALERGRHARWRSPGVSLERVSEVLGLVVLSAAVSTTVSATVGVTSLALGGLIPWSASGSVWWLWWVGDALGALVVAPVLLTWASRLRVPWRGLRLAELGALCLGLLVVSDIVLASEIREAKYLVFPFLIWAAMRFGQPEAASAVLVIAASAIWGGHDAHGPFATGTLDERLLLLNAYLAVAATTTLLVGALTAERRQAQAALKRSHDQLEARVRDRTTELAQTNQELSRQTALFELLAHHASDLIVTLDPSTTFTYVSPSVRGMLGYEPEELIGTSALDLLHPEDRANRAQAAVGTSQGWTSLIRTRRKDGSYAWTEANVTVRRDPTSGAPVEFASVMRDVTPRVEAERRFRSLLESAPDAMVLVDGNGQIGMVNELTERLFGYSRQELIGRPVEMLLPERFRHGHVAQRNRYIQQPATRPMGSGLELYGRRKDGSEFPVEISLSPLNSDDGMLTISAIRDVTERKQAEAVRAHLAAIVESSGDAIVGKTLEGVITSWNPAAEQLYGYASREVIGQPITLLAPPDRPDELPRLLERLRRGERVEARETQRVRKDGRLVDVALSMSPIRDGAGQIVGIASIARDITDRKRAEAEQAARAEAEAALRLRDEFLSVAAHELKTPITSLRGFAELLLEQFGQPEGPDPERARRALRTIDRQSLTLARLVGQLLDVARIGAGRLALECGPTDVAGLAQRAVAAAQARTLTHSLHLDAPPSLPAQIDPLRIEQVLVNLLDNAIKYSPGGGRIDVTVNIPDPFTVRVTVRDRGLGIPPESRARIFEHSYQAHAQSHQSGLGLGLYISRQIVELHGGRITAQFPTDGGTRMVVDLPLQPAPQPTARQPEQP